MRGRFFVVEGIDGSGKSTLAARLAELLALRRRRVLRTREPGGTRLGERIREIFLDATNADMTPLTEIFLSMASRAQLVERVIRPALRRGIDVVCDRYYYSTAAYQGAAGGLGAERILEVAERVARFDRPDLVLLLDLPPGVARTRRGDRRNRVERKGPAYQERVRRGFLALARRDRRRLRVLDGALPAENVLRNAWREVLRAL
jgi:dTMP kinase